MDAVIAGAKRRVHGTASLRSPRYGIALRFDGTRWRAGIEGRRVARQSHIAPLETPTPGYTRLTAALSYRSGAGNGTYEVLVRGGDLANAAARTHTSFLKELATAGHRASAAAPRPP